MNKNMYDYLVTTANNHPDISAMSYLGVEIKYKDLLHYVDKVSQYLNGNGLKKGDVVTIALPNIPNAVIAFYACNKLGLKCSIVHPLVPKKQLMEYMKETKSKFIFAFALNYNKIKEDLIGNDIKVVISNVSDFLPKIKGKVVDYINRKKLKGVKSNFRKLLANDFDKTISVENNDDIESIYLHSGGTTGKPKTIMLTNSNFNALANRGHELVCTDDVVGKGMLAVLPMFHGFGLAMCFHTMIVNGCTSIMFPNFNAKYVCNALKKERVNFMTGVPTMYDKLLKHKSFSGKWLSKLEFAFCGGDSMPFDLKEKFDKIIADNGGKCQLLEGYGLTETTAVVCVNNYINNRSGSVGKPISNAEIYAYDNENNKLLSCGEFGEIIVCSDTLMLGYLDDNEATNEVKIEINNKSFIKTGDYGHVDSDGFVFFKQRLKRIIKVNGVAVFPSEIEKVATSVDGVKYACALGEDSDKSGAKVVLYIELEKSSSEKDCLERLKTELPQNLIKWAIPSEIIVLSSIPLTQMGKVDSLKLSKILKT